MPETHQKRKRPWRLAALITLMLVLFGFGLRYGVSSHYLAAGKASLKSKRFDEAADHLQRARWWGADVGQVSLLKARISRHRGDSRQMSRDLQDAVAGGVSNTLAERERLLMEIQMGGARQHEARLREMLTDNVVDDGPTVLEAFVLGHQSAGQYHQSQQVIDMWLTADDNDPHAYLALAKNYFLTGRHESSVEAYEKALSIDDKLIDAHLGLGHAFFELDRHGDAVEQFSIYVSHVEDSLEANMSLILAMLKTKDHRSDAIQLLEDRIRCGKARFFSRYHLASAFLSDNRAQDAIDIILPLMSEFKEDVSLNYLLSQAYSDTEDLKKAEQYFNQHQIVSKALKELDQRAKENSGNQDYDFYVAIGQALMRYRWDSAEPWFLRALSLNPTRQEAYRALAVFHDRSGNEAVADRYRQSAVDASKQIEIDLR